MKHGPEIAAAAEVLRSGGCVAFPTETVYGLGADATNAVAVARIFAIKERPRFDPLIVHLAGTDDLDQVAASVPAAAQALIDSHWPGPLTIVLAKHPNIPDIVTAGLDTVAVRVPDHPLARALIEASEKPIAAPSANPFGYVSPTCAAHVRAQLGERVGTILDGGPCRVGVESTIVSLAGGSPRLLREGGTPREVIERQLGAVEVATENSSAPDAPGQLSSHYATRTPLTVVDDPARIDARRRTTAALLAPIGSGAAKGFAAVRVLSPNRNLEEAAAHLFAAMRDLDAGDYERIYAVAAPDRGLGRAINDRLRRATRLTNSSSIQYRETDGN